MLEAMASPGDDMDEFKHWMKSDAAKKAEAAQAKALVDKKALMKKIQLAASAVGQELKRAKEVQQAVAHNPAAVRKANAAVKATQLQISKAAASVHLTRLNMKKQLAIVKAAAKKAKGTDEEDAVEKIHAAVASMVADVAGVSLKG